MAGLFGAAVCFPVLGPGEGSGRRDPNPAQCGPIEQLLLVGPNNIIASRYYTLKTPAAILYN